MNPSNLLFGVLLTVIQIGFQLSEAHKGVDLIKLTPREAYYTKTLVLDLDETLIHGYKSDECAGEQSFPIRFHYQGNPYSCCIDLREGVVETLQHLEEGTPEGDRWELIIWTAGSNDYGAEIAKHLRKQGIEIAHVIGKETSTGEMKEGEKDRMDEGTKKDLRRLINADSRKDPNPRTLETMVIVDNRPEKCYPGENTIGIRSWYGFHGTSLMKEKEKWEDWEWKEFERSASWSIFGSDEGKAMNQLKVELDELAVKRITLERLNDKLQGEKREKSEQMIYYRAQPMIMSKQIEMVRKAGRQSKYSNTLILDLYRDFLYFENGVPCSGDIDCWEMENGQTARFRDDAINTLKTLQQAPGGERWELIDWTDASQHLAVKLQHFLSTQGVEIAHTLAAHEWDTADYHFEKN